MRTRIQAPALALCTNILITLTGWPLYSGLPANNDGPDEGRTISLPIQMFLTPRTEEEIRTTGLEYIGIAFHLKAR